MNSALEMNNFTTLHNLVCNHPLNWTFDKH